MTLTNMHEYRNLTRNVLAHFRRAEPSALESGLSWYDRTFTVCEYQGWRNGYTVTQAACALAHLSPRVTFRQNLELLADLLAGRHKPAAALTRSWDAARRASVSEDPLATFSRTALKTGTFARAILGDHNAVVVDIWAARAAGVGESMIRSTSGYHMVAEAYRRGAKRVGLSPRDLQAITWVAIRGSAN